MDTLFYSSTGSGHDDRQGKNLGRVPVIDNQTPQLSDRELLVRIDTKLDGVIEDKKDHEIRIRRIEDASKNYATTQQVTAVETQAQASVTKKQLWTGLGAVFGAATTIWPIAQSIINR